MADKSDFCQGSGGLSSPSPPWVRGRLRPVRLGFVVDRLLLWQVYVREILGFYISVIIMLMLDILTTSSTNDDSVPK